MASPQTITGLTLLKLGNLSYATLVVTDPNGNLAMGTTPMYQTPGGILVPGPADANGNPYTKLAGSSALYAGSETLSTTAAQMPAQTGTEILIQNAPSNTVNISIGSATSQSIVLVPGQSMTLSLSNLNLLYAVAASGTPALNWVVIS